MMFVIVGFDPAGRKWYGFELAQKAGKKPVFAVFSGKEVFIFIGTKKSVLKRIQKLTDRVETQEEVSDEG